MLSSQPLACLTEAQLCEAFELEDDVKDHAQVQRGAAGEVNLGEVQLSEPFG